MIVNTFKLGNTTVIVDDTYMSKTEEERKRNYEIFNQIGCEILYKEI